ncbi:nicotinamide riboside transporter PnuC [Glaciecola siphonariae]|uniref:Nicotinamide riboside transporter PnuC n=1 Tax=Glaciecola siphonariae TaxID=521012 RepID=A0ABV9LU89_9ALTE
METIQAIVTEQWQQQSVFEIFAVILSIAYVWLAAEESIWCWPAAFISTSLFVFVFWDVSLLFQLMLNLYYLVMAVVGFMHWRRSNDEGFVALTMPFKLHATILGAGLLLTFAVTFLTKKLAGQWFGYEYLYLDAGITMFSLLATYLTVKKYLQSWMYWSIINFLSIYLFVANGLYLTVILMLIYIAIAMRGYINWSQDIAPDDTPYPLNSK